MLTKKLRGFLKDAVCDLDSIILFKARVFGGVVSDEPMTLEKKFEKDEGCALLSETDSAFTSDEDKSDDGEKMFLLVS